MTAELRDVGLRSLWLRKTSELLGQNVRWRRCWYFVIVERGVRAVKQNRRMVYHGACLAPGGYSVSNVPPNGQRIDCSGRGVHGVMRENA